MEEALSECEHQPKSISIRSPRLTTRPGLANANDTISINLVRAGKEPGKSEFVFEEGFNPTFTYTIFGEEETIFGYRNPNLHQCFRAHDLQPSLEFKHGGVFQPIGETKAMDVPELLKDFLDEGRGVDQATLAISLHRLTV